MIKSKRPFLPALGGFFTGAVLSVAIFIAATPFCNEACPIWIVDTVYLLILAMPAVLAVCFWWIFRKKGHGPG